MKKVPDENVSSFFRFAAAVAICIAATGPSSADSADLGMFNVTDYQAVNDGKTLCTEAIQAAVDACAQRGGGTVYFPPGIYLSGTIVLKSNVTLHLEAGAELRGSRDLKDYPSHVPELRSYTDLYTERSLLYAERAENITILGRGVIEGQSKHFQGWRTPKLRPYLIRFVECRNVRVRDVTLQRSANWTLHLLSCDDVVVDRIRINNLPAVNHNGDGIDVDSSRNIRIANCDISAQDDAIVLKSTTPRRCECVTVTNCTLKSERNGFKLGTETVGGFRSIVMSNCTIRDAHSTGITLLAVDGGDCEGICINNVVIENVRFSAIFLRLGNRARPYWIPRPGDKPSEAPPPPKVAALRDVIISNVIARGTTSTGIFMTGLPDHPIENVTLSNIKVEVQGRGNRSAAQRLDVPENESDYPNSNKFGPLPAYGVYARHMSNLRLHNLDLSFRKDDARAPVVCQDVRDLDLFGLRAATGTKADCVIRLRHSENAFIHGCRLDNPVDRIIDSSADCTGLRMVGNAFDESPSTSSSPSNTQAPRQKNQVLTTPL
ncbi:MAG: glycoside hydrolase family 28 protein [Pirellulales bacterium]|nr:glycoside hydrolase family 28 protein [Pirellulales bacterium]